MWIERQVEIDDDEEFPVKAKWSSEKEIQLTLPIFDLKIYISWEKLREVFRDFVKVIKACRPSAQESKEGVCMAKSTMTEEELKKALGW